MKTDELAMRLSKFGTVQICNAKSVFVLLITDMGQALKFGDAVEIQEILLNEVCTEYPYIEAMKNGAGFYCSVLTKRNGAD